MATTQKFTFDECFDTLTEESPAPPASRHAAGAPTEPPKPVEPTYSLAELEAARERAFQEGRAAGAAEARAEASARHEREIEQAIAAATAEVGRQLAAIADALIENRELMESSAARVGAAVPRKATPPIARRHAAESVETLVRDVLGGLIGEPRIAVNVGDNALDEVKRRMDRIKEESGFPGDFIVIADPELEGPECRVQWSDGGVETCYERVWDEIDRVLGAFYRATPPVAAAPMPAGINQE